MALTTGLRYNEILTLSRSDFDLVSNTVTIQGKNAKNGHTVELPLRESLANKIREYFSDCPALPHVLAFEGMIGGVGARMLRVDLEAAGIDVVTSQGKADFHSLRHTFCTLLARSGVQPQIAQKLMRHSSIDLTMNFYTHILMEDKMSAVSQLPDLWSSGDSNTGTAEGDLLVFCKG